MATSHAYAAAGPYTVTLTVADNDSATGTHSHDVSAVNAANAAPIASFTATCGGLTCSVDGSASTDSDGNIASYAWAFGDGTTGSGPTTSHMYSAAGMYTVTLTVTDNGGATSTQSHFVSAVNAAPIASFTATCSGLTCSVDGSASTDSDGNIASYAWAFGDGTTGSGPTTSHMYSAAGMYTVTLTVTDNGGAAHAQSKSVVTTQAHAGDLDRASTNQGGRWTAIVTIVVHDSSHGALANATVTGSWTPGGTTSCTTNGNGQCKVSRSSIPGGIRLVTFRVSGVTHAVLTYKPADNHDQEGESNGTSITVSRR